MSGRHRQGRFAGRVIFLGEEAAHPRQRRRAINPQYARIARTQNLRILVTTDLRPQSQQKRSGWGTDLLHSAHRIATSRFVFVHQHIE